jgi:hypothetical protein
MQIEHTRDINFTVQVNKRILLSVVAGVPVFAEIPVATFTGMLKAGQDGFTSPSNMRWDADALAMDVIVTLEDSSLQQLGARYKYQKSFSFTSSSPASLEP